MTFTKPIDFLLRHPRYLTLVGSPRLSVSSVLPHHYTPDDDSLTSPLLRACLHLYQATAQRLKNATGDTANLIAQRDYYLDEIDKEIEHLRQICTPQGAYPTIIVQWLSLGRLIAKEQDGKIQKHCFVLKGHAKNARCRPYIQYHPDTHQITVHNFNALSKSSLHDGHRPFRVMWADMQAHNDLLQLNAVAVKPQQNHACCCGK